MNPFLSHLSARVDATAFDLKTSLHEHVDSTVNSRLDQFKLELASLVQSGVIECIRVQRRNQHWKVETTYTPVSAHQHNLLNEVPLMATRSTSFIEGLPPPLLTEVTSSAGMSATEQCIADVTFPSGHSVSIPLYNVSNQHESQDISEQSTHTQPPPAASMDSSLLGELTNDNWDDTEQDTSPQSAQPSNNEQIDNEPFQTENRASLVAATSAIVSDAHRSTNEVSSVSLSNVSSPTHTAEHVQLPDNSHIKQEHLDDQTDNGQQQQMDNDDSSTNALNVTLNIETMDCDFEVVKLEIKEEDEDDHDTDCRCDRCIVKRKLVTDDNEQADKNGQVKRLRIDEMKDVGGMAQGDDNNEVIQPNVDNGELLCDPSLDIHNAPNENESDDEGGANLATEEHMFNTANQPNDQTVPESLDLFLPSTSTGQGSNRTALYEQANVSTHQNATKRNQQSSNRTVKRQKQTLEEEDGENGEEDIADEDRQKTKKVLVIYLNCTEAKCNVKLNSLVDLYHHWRTAHKLLPFKCFATNCNSRFENGKNVSKHIKLHHSQNTRFICPICHQDCYSQAKCQQHWYKNHLNGQFKCNCVSDCDEVTATKNKMDVHQQIKHKSNLFPCTHDGCTASFDFNSHLKLHEIKHLDIKPFHCTYPQCSHRSKRRSHLIKHIRTQHFGLPKSMKEQKAKNIVDLRDPNDYVRELRG